jgi:hypothetical protein
LGSAAQCEAVAVKLDDLHIAVAGDAAAVVVAQFGCVVVGVPTAGLVPPPLRGFKGANLRGRGFVGGGTYCNVTLEVGTAMGGGAGVL